MLQAKILVVKIGKKKQIVKGNLCINIGIETMIQDSHKK
jgi:hypothetical protein